MKQRYLCHTIFLLFIFFASRTAVWAGGGQEVTAAELTEAVLLQKVMDEISQDRRIDEENIEVEADGNTIVLNGTASSRYEREAAEKEARSIAGVQDVINLITVEQREEYPNDETIGNTVQVLLNLDAEIDGSSINIGSKNGVITLTGEVETLSLKQKAEEISRSVTGVVRVINKIAIVPTEEVSDELIAREIIKALDRNQFVEIDHINVVVKNGNVTLAGMVKSRQAYETALEIAAITAGVADVDNRLSFRPAEARPTDDVIHSEIKEQLLWDSRVHGEDITVLVNDGEVTLKGVVNSYTAKMAGEEDAWNIAGVEAVSNKLKVTHDRELFSEELVRTQVEQRLGSVSDVDRDEITINLEGSGKLRLTGTVDAYWKKNRIRAKAGEIAGVRSVKMEIAVVPTDDIEDEVIAEKIIRSLKRKVAASPADVEVEVRKGEVTLSGSVPTWMAKESALNAAETIEGVRAVHDNILIKQ
jgi:osmotically-inducible protein OsmY